MASVSWHVRLNYVTAGHLESHRGYCHHLLSVMHESLRAYCKYNLSPSLFGGSMLLTLFTARWHLRDCSSNHLPFSGHTNWRLGFKVQGEGLGFGRGVEDNLLRISMFSRASAGLRDSSVLRCA